MNGAQKIGAIYRITNQLSPLLLFLSLLLNFGLVIFLGQKPQVVSSNVIAYDPTATEQYGVPFRLECESGSEGRKRKAIAIANNLMKVLYEYERGEKTRYVAKYKNLFPYIKSGSKAERMLRSSAEKRARDLETDTSTFHLDYGKTKAAAVNGIMYAAVSGKRELRTPKGRIQPEDIKLNVTMEIGGDNASFVVTDISNP